jgi:SAM-dependent MidA family methyltransferase
VTERLDRFMARAAAAYYAAQAPFADFTTAPEISQVFGEILGLWAAVVWQAMGRPDPVLLAEAGPGRGTLMADAMRAIAAAAPDFRAALRLHLIETSPRLRAAQAERLPAPAFHDGLATLPELPLLLLANEFLDALPIRQFVRRNGAWRERHVADGRFVELPAEADLTDLPEGTVIERGEAAQNFTAALCARLGRHGGAALLLDYGPEASAPGDSLQAIHQGRPADPLLRPGAADITAHVDFAALVRVAQAAGCAAHGPIPQGIFLTRLGLFQRTDRLAQGRTPAAALELIDRASRLVEPDRMGRLFKALALCHPGLPPPPGFEPVDSA